MAAEFFPTWKRRQRASHDATLQALRQREKLVAEGVIVKVAVCAGNRAGFVDGLLEKFGEGNRSSVAHMVLLAAMRPKGQRSARPSARYDQARSSATNLVDGLGAFRVLVTRGRPALT